MFGTDGVRAVAGQFPLTAEWVLKLGAATAEVLRRSGKGSPSVVIGKDTRQSGDMLEAALAAGLTSRGVSVIHLGVLPTPAVSYLTRHLAADAGVVISASHNPAQDNGIKFFGASGEKLDDELEAEIEATIHALGDLPPVTGADIGAVTNYSEAERLYMSFLRGHAPDLSGLRIALDCANGAAFRIAPRVFQAAGADVFAVYTNPDGKNINRGCGSTSISHLQEIVKNGECDLGVAFDGDADRAMLVDSRGNVLNGDHMLLANARARKEETVVATIMSNMGLEVKLREEGKNLERTDVGDRYVHARLRGRGFSLGGEQSGHMLFLDVAPTGDGVLTALLTLASVRQLGLSLDQIYDDLELYPQVLLGVKVADKKKVLLDDAVAKAVSAAEEKLRGRGRVNLRPSGTESLIRVMVEGPDEAEIGEVAQSLAALIEERSSL